MKAYSRQVGDESATKHLFGCFYFFLRLRETSTEQLCLCSGVDIPVMIIFTGINRPTPEAPCPSRMQSCVIINNLYHFHSVPPPISCWRQVPAYAQMHASYYGLHGVRPKWFILWQTCQGLFFRVRENVYGGLPYWLSSVVLRYGRKMKWRAREYRSGGRNAY